MHWTDRLPEAGEIARHGAICEDLGARLALSLAEAATYHRAIIARERAALLEARERYSAAEIEAAIAASEQEEGPGDGSDTVTD